MTAAKSAASVTSLADVRNVKAMLAEAEPVVIVGKLKTGIAHSRGGVDPGEWKPGALGLPEDCPVTPLGVSGDALILLDTIGQVRVLDKPYGKLSILNLFGGRLDYLEWAWPRWGKDRTLNGFANEEALAALIRACKAKGAWEASDRTRGRGCWIDAGGSMVVHTGDKVMMRDRYETPGEYDGRVYPTRPRIARPWTADEDVPFSPAGLLRPLLRTWNWARPDVDPHLLLGWVGAAILGAALPWRPMAYLTGDKGTGKSTLQELVKGLLGSWLIQTTNTTAAGIYQHVGTDALPVSIDEFEGQDDNRAAKRVLELARQASSGGQGLRGGDRGTGTEFVIRSAFLFSSINAPPMRPQDLSRMALLRLQKLTPGTAGPTLDPTTLGIVGRCMMRRLIDEWPRFHETFNAFAGELAEAGMDGRGQAQFGTLLTCADMIEHEGWHEERLRFAVDADGDLVPWRELLRPQTMAEFEDANENWRACLSHLLSVRVEAWRSGKRHTIGQVIQAYFDNDDCDVLSANDQLAQAGLRIVFPHDRGGPHHAWLAVHNQGPLIRDLFEGSIWAGDYGAGLWSAALRQGPQGRLWMLGQTRVNGVQARATLLSLDGLYGKDGLMRDGE